MEKKTKEKLRYRVPQCENTLFLMQAASQELSSEVHIDDTVRAQGPRNIKCKRPPRTTKMLSEIARQTFLKRQGKTISFKGYLCGRG
jgi:hypothetical protein